jgi:hypothetical protein
MPERLIAAVGGSVPVKIRCIASWLANSSNALAKVNIAIDEGRSGCRVRRISIETISADL